MVRRIKNFERTKKDYSEVDALLYDWITVSELLREIKFKIGADQLRAYLRSHPLVESRKVRAIPGLRGIASGGCQEFRFKDC